jgi:hypothetical protein
VSAGQRLREPRAEASDLPARVATRNPTVEIFIWSRLAIWAAALFALLAFDPSRNPDAARWPLLSLPRLGLGIFPLFLALAVIGGPPRVHTAIVSVSALFLGVAIVQWALWQWVA